MDELEKIKSKIEKIVKDGEIKVDSLIRVPNLPEHYLTYLKKSFKDNPNFMVGEERVLDKDNLNKKSYVFYLKYLGNKNE